MTSIQISEDQWDEPISGSLLTWLFEQGAEVAEGETIAEIMVEKLQVEIEAPSSGILTHLKSEGDLVDRGEVIGLIT